MLPNKRVGIVEVVRDILLLMFAVVRGRDEVVVVGFELLVLRPSLDLNLLRRSNQAPAADCAPLPAAVDGGAGSLRERSTKFITRSLWNLLEVYKG